MVTCGKRCKMQDFCERWLKKQCANFTASLLAPVASYYMLWFCFHATIRWHAGLPICPEHAGPHACPHSIRLCFTLKTHAFIFHTRKTATFSHICLPLPKKRNKRSKKQIVLSEHFRKCGRIKFSPRTMVVEHTATRKNDQLRRDTNSKF